MQRFYWLAAGLHFGVNMMLLVAVNNDSCSGKNILRCTMGAIAGTVYALLCSVGQLSFLRGGLWQLISMVCISLIAFGIKETAPQKCFLFFLLRLAVEGIGGKNAFLSTFILCAGLYLLQRLEYNKSLYTSVELTYKNKKINLIALRDTGHDLRDPVTGKEVIVIGADIADRLVGLPAEKLRNPVDAMGSIPGLRLIPYKTVGQSAGLLLALKIHNSKIGGKKGSTLVAFAPDILDENGKFQALIGGTA